MTKKADETKNETSRELTEEEVREAFVSHLVTMTKYWAGIYAKGECESVEAAIEGAVFSTLVALDGGAMAVPGFIVAPMGTQEDMEDAKASESNYYPINDPESVKGDIAGALHDTYMAKRREAADRKAVATSAPKIEKKGAKRGN